MPDLDIFVILADLLRMIYCISAQQRLCVCLFAYLEYITRVLNTIILCFINLEIAKSTH